MTFFRDYIAYLKDNPKGYWFRRKIYGWGWTPATWQGWLTLLIFLLLIILNAYRIDASPDAVSDTLYEYIPQTAGLVVILVIICLFKSEPPRWQWGLPKNNEDSK